MICEEVNYYYLFVLLREEDRPRYDLYKILFHLLIEILLS